jgi:8-oxo-dGTP diphosphatase
MSSLTDPVPFSRIKIRTGALVFCGEDVALIRRDRPTGSHYTPPGGNVEPGEDILDALARSRRTWMLPLRFPCFMISTR